MPTFSPSIDHLSGLGYRLRALVVPHARQIARWKNVLQPITLLELELVEFNSVKRADLTPNN